MAQDKRYPGIVSSDWSECLSPNGPFDPISFNFPDLQPELLSIFRQYTGNIISLDDALQQIRSMLPEPITEERMDAYLDASFATYHRVPEFIQWCLSNDLYFIINTTGTLGYFQRAMAKGLIPSVSLVAGNPLIQFSGVEADPRFGPHVNDTSDKPKHTAQAAARLGIPFSRVVVIGDSGGDGPHFTWGHDVGACLIGSMPKQSLEKYCEDRGVLITHRFGVIDRPGVHRDLESEMVWDYMQLTDVIREQLKL